MKKIISLCIVFVMILSSLSIVSVSASKDFKMIKLKANKAYSFNLDKTGNREKIKLEKIKINKKKTKYQLVVNGKIAYSVTNKDYEDVNVYVTDTDKSDKQMEVLVLKGTHFDYAWTCNAEKILYLRYKNGKITKEQNLRKVIESKHPKTAFVHKKNNKYIVTVNGEGKLTYKVCIYLGGANDFVHFYDYLTLNNGKFVKSSNKVFMNTSLTDEDYNDISDGVNTVYTTVGGKTKAFVLKKKEEYKKIGLAYDAKGNVYFKVKNLKGKLGYIEAKKLKTIRMGAMHVGWTP